MGRGPPCPGGHQRPPHGGEGGGDERGGHGRAILMLADGVVTTTTAATTMVAVTCKSALYQARWRIFPRAWSTTPSAVQGSAAAWGGSWGALGGALLGGSSRDKIGSGASGIYCPWPMTCGLSPQCPAATRRACCFLLLFHPLLLCRIGATTRAGRIMGAGVTSRGSSGSDVVSRQGKWFLLQARVGAGAATATGSPSLCAVALALRPPVSHPTAPLLHVHEAPLSIDLGLSLRSIRPPPAPWCNADRPFERPEPQ